MASLEEIEAELKALEARYDEAYSGKDRATVDPAGIEAMLVDLQKTAQKLSALGALTAGDGAGALSDSIEARKAFFERELRLVKAAREMGPSFARFSVEGTAANFVFDRYQRHFAGQSRDTRDLGLLREMVEELKGIKKRMLAIGGKKLPPALEQDVEIVTQNIERYSAEAVEIPRAQQTGTAEQQADRWACLANQQFAIYQKHFAGQSRLTRRPGLLVRVIDGLKRYRAAMFDLKNKGLSSTANDGNISIVDGRLSAYEKELVEIRKVRSQAKLVDIMGALGGNANELFEEYRNDFAGKDRTTVSLEQLGLLLDRLDELRRQMEELGRVEKNETNTNNAAVVRDYQANWVREYVAVRAAQAGSEPATGSA